MLFHITYKVSPENRDGVQDKFKKTGGLPPSGVTMKGRWHSIDGNRGFILAEASDIVTFGKWFQEWSDSLVFETTPVLSDEEISKIIG